MLALNFAEDKQHGKADLDEFQKRVSIVVKKLHSTLKVMFCFYLLHFRLCTPSILEMRSLFTVGMMF